MIQQQLIEIIQPIVESFQLQLWGCEFRQDRGRQLLCVYVEDDKGVTIDQCTKVSREISAVLDVEDTIPMRYSLEVSSPGMSRPLFELAHYERYIGRDIKFRLQAARDGQRNFLGKIEAVSSDSAAILMEIDSGTISVNFNEIEKANLIADFSN